jgi:hypothetical protein
MRAIAVSRRTTRCTAPLTAHAQPSTKVYRIGYLRGGFGYGAEDEALTQCLRELGYAEGQNLVIEARYAQGDLERYPAFAAELVQLQVDCLVVGGIPAIRAAKQATSTNPIVMINVGGDDPVRLEFITSLARPEGNLTGVMDISAELAGKRLELLKEAFPHITRVGHLSDKNVTAHLQEVEATAHLVGVRIQPLEVHGPEELEQAFRAAGEARRGAHCRASRFRDQPQRTDCTACRHDPPGRDIYPFRVREERWPHELRGRPAGSGSPHRHVYRQNFQRHEARGPAGGAAHEICAGHQPEDRPNAWDHDSLDHPFPGG